MDMDPAILEAPYYDEVMVDSDVKGDALLLARYDGLVACMEAETYTQEKPHLVLYTRPNCPYCRKVTNYLKKEKKSIPTKDIGCDGQVRAELIQKGGKQQVPCLMINGKAMYESNEILNWLKSNKNKY